MKNISINIQQKQLIILFSTAVVIFFTRLWQGYLGGDEACYALLARQILRSGDWLVLHHPYYAEWSNFYEHPPLYMWLTAISFKLFGINDYAAKFFSAFAGLGTVVFIYLIGKKLVNHQYGFFAAFILLTTQYFLDYARKARLEVPLAFFLVLSFYFLILCLKNRQSFWTLGSGLAVAMALLTKGIPALAMVVVVSIGLLFFSESWNKAIHNIVLFLIGIGIILIPWTLLQFVYDQGRFFDWYFFKQVAWSMAGRHSSGIIHHYNWAGILFYVKKLFTEVMVPWFPVAIAGTFWMHRSHKQHNDKLRYLALLAAVIIIAAFSLVSFKKTRYIIPAVPFLSLMAAEFFINRTWSPSFAKWTTRISAAILVLVILVATLTPIPFSTNMNANLVSLIPYVNAYSASQDSILVSGMREYTVRQVYSWYLDRPQNICNSNDVFFKQWHTGAYKMGICYQEGESTMPDNGNNEPSVISGNFQLFLNNIETKRISLIHKKSMTTKNIKDMSFIWAWLVVSFFPNRVGISINPMSNKLEIENEIVHLAFNNLPVRHFFFNGN